MNHRITNWIMALCMWFLTTTAANAVTISLTPSYQSVVVGSKINVGLEVSELGSGVTPSLSVFDFNISYEPSLLAFDGVSFGDPSLGDQLDVLGFGNITSYDNSVSGLINLFELSLDGASDLETFQADSFTLATMSLYAVGVGDSTLGISANSLGDSAGNPLTYTINTGTVSVVPLPPSLPLLGTGLVALVMIRRGRKILHDR